MPNTTHQIRRAALVIAFIMGLGFAPVAAADTLTLIWDLNTEPEVTGYTVYVGTQSGVYPQTIDVGNTGMFVFSNAVPGQRYYFAVAAYGGSLVSPLSAEVTGLSNAIPVLANPGNQTSTVGQSISLPLAGSDPLGDAITYSATGLPAGLVVSQSLGWITGTVTTAGTYNVTATVSDGVLSASRSFTWTVNSVTPTAAAPVLTNPGNRTSTVGQSAVLQLQASDANGDTLTYSASALPTGMQLTASTGRIAGTPSVAGTYNVTATVSDGALSASRSFTWTVQTVNVAPVLTSPGNQTATVGQSAVLQLQGTDANGQTLTYSASGLPTGMQITASTGRIAGTPSAAGTYNVTATVSDGTLSAQRAFTWTIQAAATTPANVAPVLTNPGSQSATVGQSAVLQLQGSDANGQSLTYAASGLPSGLQLVPSTGQISGTPATAGTFQVTVSVSDGSLSAQQSFAWTVAAAVSTTQPTPVDSTTTTKSASSRNLPASTTYSGTTAVTRPSKSNDSKTTNKTSIDSTGRTRTATTTAPTTNPTTGATATNTTVVYTGTAIVRSVASAASSDTSSTGSAAMTRRRQGDGVTAMVPSVPTSGTQSLASSETTTATQALTRDRETTVEGGSVGGAPLSNRTVTTAPVSAPAVSIQTPVDQVTFAAGSTVMFSALARDGEDGDLASRIVWSSSLDGHIGTGGSVFKVMTNGIHVITATVADSRGTTRTAQITIVVGR